MRCPVCICSASSSTLKVLGCGKIKFIAVVVSLPLVVKNRLRFVLSKAATCRPLLHLTIAPAALLSPKVLFNMLFHLSKCRLSFVPINPLVSGGIFNSKTLFLPTDEK